MTAMPAPAEHEATADTQSAPRRVTTLELFFDLVFVFTITQLTVLLVGDLSFAQAGRVLLIFAVLYWMYGAYAYLTNQVPPENLARRVVLVVGMFGFLLCALAIPKVFTVDGVAFGLAYILVTAVHSALYALIHRKYVLSFALPNLAAAGCVTAAGAVQGATATDLLWLAAVLLQQVAPIISGRVRGDYGEGRALVTEHVGELDPAHFVERHGLLLIIAFGESVVAIGAGANGTRLDWPLAAGIALALALTATLWWSYFGHDESAAEHALGHVTGIQRFRLGMRAYYYSFIPMLLGIAFLAAGLKKAIAHLGAALPTPAAVVLAAGVAVFLAGDLCFRMSLRISPMFFRALGTVAVLATIPLARASAAVQLLGLTVVMVLMLVAEENARRRQVRRALSHGESITH
ncbi:low temperature requirement protein A [Catenulispora sp. NL8]|uniref:Low temperature requirement protein A n=1 Tax=Catenulispora pinistramenti TaxID=2705254 RepID=A0ABS5L4I2_9ACTN|nr:low temperature requirement protein A [Catenulispora pinistramenti]MBS2553020.1 low temperature requirement protein A [Catenulispora pinistramenti]